MPQQRRGSQFQEIVVSWEEKILGEVKSGESSLAIIAFRQELTRGRPMSISDSGINWMYLRALPALVNFQPAAEDAVSNPRRAEGRNVVTKKRTTEIFTAGCPACDEAVKLVESIICPSCDLQVLDMRNDRAA